MILYLTPSPQEFYSKISNNDKLVFEFCPVFLTAFNQVKER